MDPKKLAIAKANSFLQSERLPSYEELATMLKAAENKLAAMEKYHSGPARTSIGAMREIITALVKDIPSN